MSSKVFEVRTSGGWLLATIDAPNAAEAVKNAKELAHRRCLHDYESFLDVARVMKCWDGATATERICH